MNIIRFNIFLDYPFLFVIRKILVWKEVRLSIYHWLIQTQICTNKIVILNWILLSTFNTSNDVYEYSCVRCKWKYQFCIWMLSGELWILQQQHLQQELDLVVCIRMVGMDPTYWCSVCFWLGGDRIMRVGCLSGIRFQTLYIPFANFVKFIMQTSISSPKSCIFFCSMHHKWPCDFFHL